MYQKRQETVLNEYFSERDRQLETSPDFGADLAAGGPELPQRRDVNSPRVT